MIYTTYIAQISKIPEEALILLICRYPPKTLKPRKNMIHLPALSPSDSIRDRYRDNRDFNWFSDSVTAELNRPSPRELLRGIATEKRDVYVVCYEKDDTICHRSVVAEILRGDFSLDISEFIFDK